MSDPFFTGVSFGVGFFLYTAVYRYRNLSRKFNETRTDRAVRVLRKVAWIRVVQITLGMGIFAFVLWHGVGDLSTSIWKAVVLE